MGSALFSIESGAVIQEIGCNVFVCDQLLTIVHLSSCVSLTYTSQMRDEMPADVRSSLGQLLAEARKAATDGDAETATSLLASAHTVATNKLPDGHRRDRLRHGCQAAEQALPDEQLVAAYISAMEQRLPDE